MRDTCRDGTALYLNCGAAAAYKIYMCDKIIQIKHTHTHTQISTCKTDEI